jgi:ribosomal protein L11 methyltransferase
MREVVLTVPRRQVEGVLDRLLPILPGGVREVERGNMVELHIRGADVPPLAEIVSLAGGRGRVAHEHEVPDDWRERRVADYEPDVIGQRLVVAPEWAPRSGAEIEIVLGEGAVFGGGSHPTTRCCLELMLELPPAGSFADLGCGTGVLGILAAHQGWAPVLAFDLSPESVQAARDNGRRNGVDVRAQVLDLSAKSPPAVEGFVANIPPAVHLTLAPALPDPLPSLGLISGFHSGAEARVVGEAYDRRGLVIRRRIEVDGWSVLLLVRDLS